MNALLTHWKLFATFLLLGLFVSFGLRATGTAEKHSMKRSEAQPRRDDDTRQPQAVASGDLLLDLGNEACPIMGGDVDGKTYGEWNHLRIGYCCPGCDRKFQKDPEGALNETDIEWRAAAKAVEEYMAATGDHKEHKLAAIRKQWTVVREPSGG